MHGALAAESGNVRGDPRPVDVGPVRPKHKNAADERSSSHAVIRMLLITGCSNFPKVLVGYVSLTTCTSDACTVETPLVSIPLRAA
jgi:hypothetical protein